MASAALVHRLRAATRIRYWKPIQTGIEQDDDTAEAARLGATAADEIFDAGVRLPRPVSPHLAARLSGTSIDLPPLVARAASAGTHVCWIVEGAGGALVPLNDVELMTDLMAALALPVLVVARSSLGTINHTLLTLEALRARGLLPAGVLMNGAPNADNRRAIERYGGVRVVGELPPLDPLDAASLGAWAAAALDVEGHLLELVR